MDTSKIIKGVVSNGRYTVTAPIVKEDYGLYLRIEGVELPSTYEVDFSNSENNGTSVTMIGNADGVLIPSQFISTGKDVFAFLYHVGEDFGRTVYKFRIPNKVRPDRTNEQPTPEEQSTIDQVIASLNDAVDRAEDAEQAIEDMSVSATTLAEGASATVTKTESEGVVHLAFGIPKGATGAQGERGEKGDKGDKGDTGATGAQGIQGAKGDTGADGYSPTVTITPITGGHRITITDADGEHSADVMDGTGNVDDVQINGTSIVEDGVANVPTASASRLGVIKTSNANGIYVNSNGDLSISEASSANVKTGTNEYKPITPHIEHEATFFGLAKASGDTSQSASSNPVGQYTDEAKAKIQSMLGFGGFELIKTVELTEDSANIEIDTDEAGNVFRLTEFFFIAYLQPSASTTQNATAYVKNNRITYYAALQSIVRTTLTNVSGYTKNILVPSSNQEASVCQFALGGISNVPTFYWNGKMPQGAEHDYSEYFSLYIIGTAKFGAGTKLLLFGRRK